MRIQILSGAILLSTSLQASAVVTFIGSVAVTGTGTDLSGIPDAPLLEDGSRPNALTGFGSGFAYSGFANRYVGLEDRGPNKSTYNPSVDNTVTYPNRYQTFDISVKPTANPNSFEVTYGLVNTTLLKNESNQQFVGISSAFTGADPGQNLRLDPEGIRVAPDGTVYISDEYGPNLYHFNQQGQRIGVLTVPDKFKIAQPTSTIATEMNNPNNAIGRYTNRGMEGLAISPDGKTLVGAMQGALVQDGGLPGLNIRFLKFDLDHPNNPPQEFVYQLNSTTTSISEILAVNDHEFLVDERNASPGAAGIKKLYKVDFNQLTAPTDVSTGTYAGTTASNGLPTTSLPGTGITPLNKTLFADIDNILRAANPFTTAAGLPDKIEGYAFGPDLPDGRHLLLATNDNDFAAESATTFPNYIFAFAVDPSDLPNFQAQTPLTSFVPEPATLGVSTLLTLAALTRRRKRTR